MANDKSYAQFIDIPNQQGGTDRKWMKDKEAQELLASIPSTYATKQELASTGVFDGDTLVL